MRPPSLKAADFQRALGSRPLARTAHFVLHSLPRVTPAAPLPVCTDEVADGLPASAICSLAPDLSTDDVSLDLPPVDDLPWRFGLVLPKKQARRSVTRSLIRHQAREALRRHGLAVHALGVHAAADGWVLRLKAPFDRQLFPSAASHALSAAVRLELDELWGRLLKGRA